MSKLDLTKNVNYTVEVVGEVTLHGETKPLETKVNLRLRVQLSRPTAPSGYVLMILKSLFPH